MVRDLTVKGSVTGDGFVGGIMGYANGGTAGTSAGGAIKKCSHTGDISGDMNIGGVTGFIMDGGTVERCCHTGSVSGSLQIGGGAGWIRDDGALRDCYHTGPVSGEEKVGSVCGGIRTGSIENCDSLRPSLPVNGTVLESATLTSNFVLSEEPGGEDTLTAEEFTHPESIMGWDFENVWSLENGVRPILRAVPEKVR